MLNLKQNLYIMGSLALMALTACSDNVTAGSTTIPNATADISSSSEDVALSSSIETNLSSSDEIIPSSSSVDIIESSSSNVPFTPFSTKPTAKRAIPDGEVTVYGDENGAQARCSAGKYASTKEYMASISIPDGNNMESTLWLQNFYDSACYDILESFKNSCSGLVDLVPDAACENGILKVFCYASKTDSVKTCDWEGNCTTAGPDSTIDFNTLLEQFTDESNTICSHIADGVDPTEYDLPTVESDSSIKANSSRAFIVEPNTANLDVSTEERSLLDSLAQAFTEKHTFDEIDGMSLFYNHDAEYYFSTESKRFILDIDSNLCSGKIYQEESGLVRSITKNGDWRSIEATILLVPGDAIVYLIVDGTRSMKEAFQTECSATKGSFHEYNENSFGCAVKNFTGTSLTTITSEQGNLCKNNYPIIPAL